MRTMSQTTGKLVLLCALALWLGCRLPSERAVYRRAVEALRNDPDLPADARPKPIGKAVLSLGKNAACVELPYTYAGPTGERMTGSYTVWCRRVARTWRVDRSFPTPSYERDDT